MSDVLLGTIPDRGEARDAIHVAIIPMVASEMLRPGQRVGVISKGVAGPTVKTLGIVDPYLLDVVPKGSAFWMCLLPGTVKGMRHHWVHPDFSESEERSESETWLRAYAVLKNNYDTPELAFERLIEGLKTRELFFNGSDLHGLYDINDIGDLQFHAEAYLGIKIDFNGFEFSCSC